MSGELKGELPRELPSELKMVGWREWLALPILGIPRIKAKIDTGARTSALHAFRVETFMQQGETMVSFSLHPRQHNNQLVVECVAKLLEQRWVSDSGGHREQRYVIVTDVELGGMRWPIELTLTNRDDMCFRMLLGRTALQQRLMVNPAVSYQLSSKTNR